MNLLKEKQIRKLTSDEELIRLYSENISDAKLNKIFSFYAFLRKNLNSISMDKDVLYYSVYFWFVQFKKKYSILVGNDEGLEQEGFKLLEEIDQELTEGLDWKIIEAIENAPFEKF